MLYNILYRILCRIQWRSVKKIEGGPGAECGPPIYRLIQKKRTELYNMRTNKDRMMGVISVESIILQLPVHEISFC